MSDAPLKLELERDGRLLRLTLARPKANIVDAAMIGALQAALDEHLSRAELAAVLLDAEGPHFSFGASVEEHLPAQCEVMLKQLHRLVMSLATSPVPVLSAVRGQCLGGGLELVLSGNLIFCAEDAFFGQPEIRLGVFAPAASCLLPERIGRAQAEDLLFSGRNIDAQTAFRFGLVNAVDDSPGDTAMAYFDKHLARLSSFSLRQAVKAARSDMVERLERRIAEVEQQYLDGLMSGRDPVEGLNAFIEKRTANWEHC